MGSKIISNFITTSFLSREFKISLFKMNTISPKVLCIVLYLSCQVGNAQIIIPKIGMAISDAALGEANDNFDFERKGFYAGVGVMFELNKIFSIQPELAFVPKGDWVKATAPDFSSELYQYWTLNYLEPCVLLKASTTGKKVRLFANIGPSLGIVVGGSESLYRHDLTVTPPSRIGYTDKITYGDTNDFRRFDPGFIVGCGVVIVDKIVVDVRYQRSFQTSLDYDFKAVNRCFVFSAGFPINIKAIKGKER